MGFRHPEGGCGKVSIKTTMQLLPLCAIMEAHVNFYVKPCAFETMYIVLTMKFASSERWRKRFAMLQSILSGELRFLASGVMWAVS